MLTFAATHTTDLVIGIVFIIASAGNLIGRWLRLRAGDAARPQPFAFGGPNSLRALDSVMSVVGLVVGIVLVVRGVT